MSVLSLEQLFLAWSAQLDTLDWSGVSQVGVLSSFPLAPNSASSVSISVPGKSGFPARTLTLFGENLSVGFTFGFGGFVPFFSGSVTKLALNGPDAAPELKLITTPLANIAQELLNDLNDADGAVGTPFITYALSLLDLSGPPTGSDDTPAGATDIGNNPLNYVITDGFTYQPGANTDITDYYKFSVDGAPRVVDVEVTGNTGIYEIAIYDSLDNATEAANWIYYNDPFRNPVDLPYKFLRLLGPGTYYLKLQAVQQLLWPGDGGPGQINYSLAINSFVDTTAPSSPTLSLAEDTGASSVDRITNNRTIIVNGLEEGATWEYSTQLVRRGGRNVPNWQSGSGNSFDVAPGTYGNGIVRVRQIDVAGNFSVANATFEQFTVDIDPPDLPEMTLAEDNTIINVTRLEEGAAWEFSIDWGSSWQAGAGNSFNVEPGDYADGQVQVIQYDVAGNASTANTSFAAFTAGLPTVAVPALELAADTGESGSDRITRNRTINVIGLDEGATWEYSTTTGRTWILGNGTSFAVRGGTYADGQVQVRQTVGAATSEANTSFIGFTVDFTAPVVPSMALAADTTTINVTGLEDGAIWEFSTDSGQYWQTGSGNSFNVEPGVYGQGQVRVRQTDVAGNRAVNTSFAAFTAFVSSPVSLTLVEPQLNLMLTGSKRINGVGNELANTIVGNAANNRIYGLGGKDLLTGGGGVNTFGYNSLGESLLSGFDEITDFKRTDRILAPLSVETERLDLSRGSIQSLSIRNVRGLLGPGFAPNSVAAFTVRGQAGTFIAMNDDSPGFQGDTDAIIFLRNYSINATNFVDFY